MRNAFSDALVQAAQQDPSILLLTGDHGYALFDPFRQACPDQYINCGIAEQNMVGVAAGLARAGFRPVVYGLSAFVPMRVLEQIKIDVCYENLPVILIGDGAGVVYSHLGSSHQCTEDIACARVIPSLSVLSPGDRFEMTACMQLAFSQRTPVYLRMGKSDRGDVHDTYPALQMGKLFPIHRQNNTYAILATGSMLTTARALIQQGFDADLWSVPCIKPLDQTQIHALCAEHDALILMEEHSVYGGLGSLVAELASSAPRPVRVCRIGVEDSYSQHCGTYDYLMRTHRLDILSVRSRIEDFLKQGVRSR